MDIPLQASICPYCHTEQPEPTNKEWKGGAIVCLLFAIGLFIASFFCFQNPGQRFSHINPEWTPYSNEIPKYIYEDDFTLPVVLACAGAVFLLVSAVMYCSSLEENDDEDAPKKKKIWIWVLTLVFLGLLAGGGYYLYSSKTSNISKEPEYLKIQTDNILADGHYCFEGEWDSRRYAAQSCEIEFTKNGDVLTDCAYTNLKYNARVPLNGSIRGSELHFIGDIEGKQLIINLSIISGGECLIGEGVDNAHSGDKAKLDLTKKEINRNKTTMTEETSFSATSKSILDNHESIDYEGIVGGKYRIEAHLQNENDNLKGWIYYTSQGSSNKMNLKGYVYSREDIELYEINDGETVGTIVCRIRSDNSLYGTHTNYKGEERTFEMHPK